jgi:ubiquinone biosynthesis accessory factor UbiJ
LSYIIGDAPAHELSKFGRKTVAGVKKQTLNVAGMFTEYWQEERPLIAKKRHVMQFVQEVDTLRDDTERLEKRLDKLAEKITVKSEPNQES